MDDDLFRILVATDNHLGHLEKDPIRGNDSFASFEDVLITAREKKVDCILLAGDMFHENKPSRNTMHSTIELLRKYCHGNNPVYTEVLSDPKEVLKPNFGTVNYEDPYHAIALPIYAIHGNHDDPSRECSHFQDSLSALDILAASNLVNYIGKSENVDDIEITPLLIRKGGIHIAIYALGAIRDERLNRMWNLKQVKFVRPAEEVNKQKYFNIFLLHQNRDYGRGSKNCIHESMIPEWMDLVIWGNEHEAIPRLVESLVGTYRIYQPGSSVVTSLCDRESLSFPKSMGLIEIRRTREFRLTTIPFTQLRLFKYAEASLSDDRFGLDPNDPKVEEKIKKALIRHVGQLIKSTLEEYKDKVPALTNSSTTAAATSNSTTSSSIPAISVSSSAQLQAGSGTRTIIASESPSELQSQRRFILKKPRQILIRLRVEHSGFPTVNTVRLGTQFINDVANPTDLILFAKQKARSLNDSRATEKGDSKNKKMTHENLKMLIHEGADEELQKIKIEDLVADSLQNSNKQLNLLPENEMAKALDDFVIKRFIHAISETVSEALGYMQKEIGTDANVMQAAGELGARSKSVISESAMKIKMRTELDSKSGTRVFKVKNTATDDADRNHDDQMDIDDDDDVDGVGKGKGKKAAATTAKATTARGGGRKPAAPKPATASGRGKATATASKATAGRGKATATASKATAGRGRGKKAMVDSEDEEEDDDNDALEDFDDDEDDDFTGSKSKRGAGRGVAAQPKSTTSRNYAASSNTTKPSPVILSRAVASNNNRRAVHNSELEEFSDPVKVNEAVDDILDDSEDDDFRPTHKKIVKQSKSGSGTSNALSAIANSSHGRTSQLPKPVATSTNTTYSAPSAVIDLADDDDDEKEDVWGFGGGTTSGSAGIAIQPIPSYLAKKRGGNGSNHYDDAEDDEEDGTAKGKGNGRAVEQSEKKSRRLSGWD